MLDAGRIPDVVLVKKTFPNRRKKARPRNWKLRSIAKEAEDVAADTTVVGRGALGRRGGVDQKNVERDYELFLRDLEEDKEMRAAINLYKTDQGVAGEKKDEDVKMGAGSGLKGGKRRGKGVASAPAEEAMDVEGDLLAKDDDGHEGDDETVEGEDDFPEIEMDELLEHFEEMGMDEEIDGGSEVA
jgi:nonsense-mediated mRNA decay protein 3